MCGAFLSKHGFKVVLLEMGKVAGGNLQSFVKHGAVFNTGLHYVGAMEKGQILNKIFNYLGVLDRVEFDRLDPDCYDRIIIGDREYASASGFDNYAARLISYFPGEETAIRNYVEKIRAVWNSNPFINLRDIDKDKDNVSPFSTEGLVDVINSLTDNEELKAVLLANNGLYAGMPERTPFYVHALINCVFIQSAFTVKGGSYRLADALVSIIREQGGEVMTGKKVVKIRCEELNAVAAVTEDGEEFCADNFYSSIHPAEAVKLFEEGVFRKPFIRRLTEMPNTIGSFILYIKFKKKSFRHFASSIYFSTNTDVWGAKYRLEEWPKSVMMYTSPDEDSAWAQSATVITFMHYDEVAHWEDKQRRNSDPAYEAFKSDRSERVFEMLEKRFHGIRDASESWFSSTPLTYRDYTGSPEGSMYGIAKDYKSEVGPYMPVRTRISNFIMTGQSIGVHGIMGVAMNSIIASSVLIDVNQLIREIREAN